MTHGLVSLQGADQLSSFECFSKNGRSISLNWGNQLVRVRLLPENGENERRLVMFIG